MGAVCINLILLVIALPVMAAAVYLLLLTLFSARASPLPPASRRQRFDIVVPAHNEALVIARTLAGLQAVDWPAERFRIIVVADNCDDETAAIARAQGAVVLERRDESLRGKGYALKHAFEYSRTHGWADAVAVVDADAVVSRNFLTAIGAHLDRGEHAVQVHYGVLNPDASWRTRLMTIAQGAFHIVRSRARERLRLSCGVRGNGWCVTHQTLRRVSYEAFSLSEDVEYGVALGLAGVRVAYADDAHSDAEMVAGEQASRRQRQRWEHGRLQLIRSKTGALLGASVRKPSLVCFDLALDLLILPLSFVVLNLLVLLGLASIAAAMGFEVTAWLWLCLTCALALLLYVLRGWQLSGIGLRGVLDLARAPFYLCWKVVVMLRRHDSREWVRTERERP